jgi:voltage-gated potassium channel
MPRLMKTIYEGMMLVLVMMTIITLWTENSYNSMINWIVWAVFVIDYFYRLFTSEEKWVFIKKHPFLIIAIIPFDQFFQVARIVRVIYLFRIKTITKYYISPYVKKLTYQSLTLIGTVLFLLLALESAVIWRVESSVPSFLDGLYVVFAHLLFFGHRIFEINHTLAIWTLTGTSIIGIVIQGLALQWLFTKLEPYIAKIKRMRPVSRDNR